jgi:hypothetical protein
VSSLFELVGYPARAVGRIVARSEWRWRQGPSPAAGDLNIPHAFIGYINLTPFVVRRISDMVGGCVEQGLGREIVV